MQTREDLPLWARAADAATIALILLALFVALEGGFVFWPNGLRISVRSEWRPLGWALALLVVRHLFVREAPIHRRFISKLDAAAKAPGPLPEDAPPVIEPLAPRPIRWKRVLTYTIYSALVVLLYSALTAVMTYPQVTRMSDTVAINDGDPLFSTWRLAWIAHQVPRDPAHLFNANIFYPERLTLAFSDSMLVPGLMAAPLLWLGVPQLVVYNIMLLSSFALSGATMFLLVRSLTRNSGAAFVAGFIFAFLPYRFMHYSHLELQVSHWMPLCLWALHRTIRHGRLSDGLLTGLFFALQSMSSWYYGIFLATFLIPIAAALLVGDGGRRLRASLRALTAGGVLAAVLVLPAAAPYFSARESVGERPVEEIKFYSATPQNYLAAHPQNVLYGKATHRLGGQERELFLGFFVPVLALIGLWPRLSAPRIAYALGLVLAFDLSLGLNGLLYPWLHAYALPYRGLRVPARMAMIVGLGLAVLAGYGVARVCRSPGRRRASAALVAIFTVVVAAEYYSVPELKRVIRVPPLVYDHISAPAGASAGPVLLELPLVAPDILFEPIYMYFSTFHWFKLANGYSGFSPPSYQRLIEAAANLPAPAALEELKRRSVTHVVVHSRFSDPEDYARVVEMLDSSPAFEFVTSTRRDRHDTRLYIFTGRSP